MLPFLRPDLNALQAYTPHPGGELPTVPLDQLDTNENPLDLPESLKAALALTYQQTIAANRYPDGEHGPLKSAIATYVTTSANLHTSAPSPSPSLPLTPAHISIGNGSDELIRSLLIATCLGGNGAILVAHPTFSMYGILAKTLGIPVVSIERQVANFEIDLNAAQTALDQGTIRVVFMVHPNSPTANPLTAAELSWLRSLPENILIVIDEAYFEFCQHTTLTDALSRPNWVITRTFSKAFRLAAHRVGYAVACPELISALEKVRLPYNLPAFSQAAALTALSHQAEILRLIPTLLHERDYLQRQLSQQPALTLWPSQANFLYTRLSPAGLALLGQDQPTAGLIYLFEHLRQRGTLVRHTGGGLRITVGTAAENQRTCQNLEAILGPQT